MSAERTHRSRPRKKKRAAAVALLLAAALPLLLAFAFANAQTLARPGWAGSGVTVDPWWKHAVVYEIYPRSFQDSRTSAENDPGIGMLQGISARLDYLQLLGVDAILLTPIYPSPEAATQAASQAALSQDVTNYEAIDPAYGTLEDFDTLVEQAGRRNIRVLMELPLPPSLDPSSGSALFGSIRFWLNHGIAGFSVQTAPAPGADQAAVHSLLRDLRKLVASYPGDRVLIGETQADTPQQLASMYGRNQDGLQLPMDTQVGFLNKLDAAAFRQRIQEAETQLNGNQPLLVFDNHDRERSWNRYGDGAHNEAIAKVVATLLLATRSTAVMYYGQEIGMATAATAPEEAAKGRDGEQTPMQWDGDLAPGHNAGFSIGKPWLPIPSTAQTVNVKAEAAEPTSLLAWYKRLIELRRSNSALRDGAQIMLDHDAENVLVWLRKPASGASVLVACNFSAEPKSISIRADLKKSGVRGSFLRTILQSSPGHTPAMDADAVKLEPFGVYIGQVQF